MHAPVFRCLLVSLLAAIPALRAEDRTAEQRATEKLAGLTEGESHGVAVLVARDGKIVFSRGFGLSDMEKKLPATPETKFRIGSISKQFTAAAILRLVEQGKLALADPVSKFFPEFPGGAQITLHHLLTHTSGIHSYTDKPAFLAGVGKAVEPDKLIASFQNDPPDFAPGAGFHYNNSAYFMAGEIVAKVSGKPLAAYLHETFFEPLGMKDTGVYVNAAPPPGMASGYSLTGGKLAPALDWDMSWAGGAGALYSTVGDLFRWNEALFSGKVISEPSFKLQTTPVKLPEGVDGMSYGYGLLATELRGLPVVGHGGGLNGWASDLLRFPQQSCTVVALVNALPGRTGLDAGGVSRKLAELFLEADIKKVPPPVEDRNVDPHTYPDFAGRYDYKNAIMTVSVDSNRLYAQLTGQPKNEIFPKSPGSFFWKVTDAAVVFERNKDGKVIAARHTQGGSSFKASKLDAAEVKFTAAELDAVTGEYSYGNGAVLTVTRDGDSFFAQLTGQPKYPIFPKSSAEFEWRIVPASIKLVKDKDGKVTKVIHHQNGTTIDAPKVK